MWGRVLEAIACTSRLLVIAVIFAESMHAKTRLLGSSVIRSYSLYKKGKSWPVAGLRGLLHSSVLRRTFQSASGHSWTYIDLVDERRGLMRLLSSHFAILLFAESLERAALRPPAGAEPDAKLEMGFERGFGAWCAIVWT